MLLAGRCGLQRAPNEVQLLHCSLPCKQALDWEAGHLQEADADVQLHAGALTQLLQQWR